MSDVSALGQGRQLMLVFSCLWGGRDWVCPEPQQSRGRGWRWQHCGGSSGSCRVTSHPEAVEGIHAATLEGVLAWGSKPQAVDAPGGAPGGGLERSSFGPVLWEQTWEGVGTKRVGYAQRAPRASLLRELTQACACQLVGGQEHLPGLQWLVGGGLQGTTVPSRGSSPSNRWRDEWGQVLARSLETESEVGIFWKWFIGGGALRKAEKGCRGRWGRN